jgi:hypothetical protein
LAKGPRCSEFGFDPAEFALEYFRSPDRHGGPLLLPPSVGELDEFVERALGYPAGWAEAAIVMSGPFR